MAISSKIMVDNKWQDNLSVLHADVNALSCALGEKTSMISFSCDELRSRIEVLEEEFQRLSNLLRPVLDEQIVKPKQKWLWEIFEPNDLDIDFPYNL